MTLRGVRTALVLPMLNACNTSHAPVTDSAAVRAATPPVDLSPTDSIATIARMTQRATVIDRDTTALQRVARPLSLGAGAGGTVIGWRAGPVWHRVRVESVGDRFQTRDDFWLENGVLLGARLDLTRDGKRHDVDSIWFRDGRLYRWKDAEGRHLNRSSRSTVYQTEALRERLDTLIHTLSIESPAQRSVPNDPPAR
jgi:hypothetical protein